MIALEELTNNPLHVGHVVIHQSEYDELLRYKELVTSEMPTLIEIKHGNIIATIESQQ